MVWSQDEYAEIVANPNPVEKDQQITITLKTNVEGQIDLDLPDEFEQSGPTQSGMSSSVNYSNGGAKVVRFSFQKISGHFEDEGTYSIGPAKIHGKNGVVSSNVIKITVRKRQNMVSENPADNMNQAIFGIIQQSSKEIYEGQPLVLEGKVYSQVDILQVERYVPFELEGPAEKHDLQRSNQVTRSYEQIGGRNVMTFRIGKRVVFPEKTGTFEIDPFQTILYYDDQRSIFPERAKIRSNESSIRVKPLPDGVPASFIEGVGSYKLTASIDSNRTDQGNVITFRIRVMGYGNLHNIEAPQLKLPKGMILYGDPEIDDSVKFTSKGAEGMKTFTYFVQANSPGTIKIPTIEAGYFDIESEEYVVLKADLPKIIVNPSDNAVASIGGNEEFNEKTIEMMPPVKENVKKIPSDSMFTGWRGGILATTPLALAFLLGGFVRYRKSSENRRVNKQKSIAVKNEVINDLKGLRSSENNIESLQAIKRALQRYLAIQLGGEPFSISTSFLSNLDESKLSPEVRDQIIKVFRQIDELRYSGGAVQTDIDSIIDKAETIVNNV